IQWRVRAFYICAAQAQQDVFISQKKVPLIDAPTLKASRANGIPLKACGKQVNGSSQVTMEKTLEGVCIPSHRVAPSSLTGQK
ncbi:MULTISPECIES: hypothetical protein, partial [unclassified Undibacterium]|uniref:hypothetical protein n=1 Tax=unclassified Undibacterium TaxID=2630295 RepID=UPI002B225312